MLVFKIFVVISIILIILMYYLLYKNTRFIESLNNFLSLSLLLFYLSLSLYILAFGGALYREVGINFKSIVYWFFAFWFFFIAMKLIDLKKLK